MFRIYLLVFILLHTFTAFSLELSDDMFTGNFNITPYLKIKETSSSKPIPDFSNVKLYGKDEIHRSYSDKTLWLNFHLTNKSNKEKNTIVHFSVPLTGRVELYKSENGIFNFQSLGGSAIPVNKRSMQTEHTAFKLNLPPHSEGEYLLKLKTHHLLYTELYVTSELGFLSNEHTILNVFVFYLGVFFALFFYNFFFFIKLKDPLYIVYCVFSFMLMLSFCIVNGIADYILKFESFTLSYYLMSFSSMAGVTTIIFTYLFLDLPTSPRWIRIINGTLLVLLGAHVVIGALSFVDSLVVVFGPTIDILILTTVIWVVFLSFYSLFKGHVMAKWLTVSWLVMGSFVFGWFLMNFGFIDHNVWTQNFLLWGHILEMAVVSLALSSRFSILATDSHLKKIYSTERSQYQKLYRLLSHDVSNFIQLINTRLMRSSSGANLSKEGFDPANIEKLTNRILQVVEIAKTQESIILKKNTIQLERVIVLGKVKEALEILKDELRAKDIEVSIHELDLSTPVVSEEKSLVNEVLVNTIKNAIKFSPKGSKINISAEQNLNFLNVKIIDNGLGLSKEQIRMFESEGHIHSTFGLNGEKGTGLGLSIVQGFMRLYGGNTKLYSRGEACGTTVQLEFPKASE